MHHACGWWVCAVTLRHSGDACAGGQYIWCTSAAPSSRRAYFKHLGAHDLAVYVLGGGGTAGTAPISDASALRQLRSASGQHFVYVLTMRA